MQWAISVFNSRHTAKGIIQHVFLRWYNMDSDTYLSCTRQHTFSNQQCSYITNWILCNSHAIRMHSLTSSAMYYIRKATRANKIEIVMTQCECNMHSQRQYKRSVIHFAARFSFCKSSIWGKQNDTITNRLNGGAQHILWKPVILVWFAGQQ